MKKIKQELDNFSDTLKNISDQNHKKHANMGTNKNFHL